MEKRETKHWQRLIRLANAKSSDDLALAARFVIMLRAWAIFLPTDPSFVPSLAKEARRIQPDIQILLRLMAGVATRAEAHAAREILRTHRREAKTVSMPPALRGARMVPFPSGFNVARSRTDRQAFYLRAKSEKGERFRPVYQVPDYSGPLDPVCTFVREVLDEKRGREPIRLCQLPSCGRFFMRRRRRRFCTAVHKRKFHSRRGQMGRTKRRDYQYAYLAKRLLASGGVKAIKARMKQVMRRKIEPEKRRRLLATLHAVLRHAPAKSGGQGVPKPTAN